MQEKITVEQALEMTANLLMNIEVPISMLEKIAVPINTAVNNLKECIAAIRQENERQNAEQNQEKEDVEIVGFYPEGEMPKGVGKIVHEGEE